MKSVPDIDQLKIGDKLNIEFDEVSCLIGPQRWLLEFSGGNPELVAIRTLGRNVYPKSRVLRLEDEQKQAVNTVLRSLASYLPSGTSHCNFRISLLKSDGGASTWKFEGVGPRAEVVGPHLQFIHLCHSVEQEHKKLTIWDNLRALPLLSVFAAIYVIGLGIVYLWQPLGSLRRRLRSR